MLVEKSEEERLSAEVIDIGVRPYDLRIISACEAFRWIVRDGQNILQTDRIIDRDSGCFVMVWVDTPIACPWIPKCDVWATDV